jgi:hypothetical protein
MKFRTLPLAALACILPLAPTIHAQDIGAWRAASKTAESITGDVSFSDLKVSINFSSFTIAQIRTLQAAEAAALFNLDKPTGAGNLYRLDIPAGKRFLHHNTLCGVEDTQWIATWVEGRTLQLAFFSGSAMPALTPDTLNNNSSLCGTFTYMR